MKYFEVKETSFLFTYINSKMVAIRHFTERTKIASFNIQAEILYIKKKIKYEIAVAASFVVITTRNSDLLTILNCSRTIAMKDIQLTIMAPCCLVITAAIQNYWWFGLCPSSSILKLEKITFRKLGVCEGGDTCFVGSLRKK
jgi:hypothetical protein